MQEHHSQQPTVNIAEMDKVEMAREILETGKVMELQGLKAILKTTIQNPMVPSSAGEDAEKAFQIAADLETEVKWRETELRGWASAKRLKVLGDGKTVVDPLTKKTVEIPDHMLEEPNNLKMDLDYEVAQIGMHAVRTVYNDIIAAKVQPSKQPGGIMRREEEEKHADASD